MADLVRVASFLNVAEAELAQARLAMEGIPSTVGNAAVVLMDWEYSNATGGVKLFVRDFQAPRARVVLKARPTPPQWQLPPWRCAQCGAEIDGSWLVCWSCGSEKNESHQAPSPAVAEPADDRNELSNATKTPDDSESLARHAVAVLVHCALLMMLIVALGVLPAALVATIVVAVCFLFRRMAESQAGMVEAPDAATAIAAAAGVSNSLVEVGLPDEADDADAPTFHEIVAADIQRAWRAAVLALGFPPLAFYSLWLLWKIPLRGSRLAAREKRRYFGAWTVALLILPLAGSFLLAIVAIPFYMVYYTLAGK
jgi:hypothetical protein